MSVFRHTIRGRTRQNSVSGKAAVATVTAESATKSTEKINNTVNDNSDDEEGDNSQEDFESAFTIYRRLIRRDLYKVVYHGNRTDIYDRLPAELQSKITIKTIDVGFVNSKKPNPFDHIHFYSPVHRVPYTVKISEINSLTTDNYYEKIVYLIVKDSDYVETVADCHLRSAITLLTHRLSRRWW